MARFRIVQEPSPADPQEPMYEVQEKVLWWWEYRMYFTDLRDAERWIIKTLEATDRPFVETRVVQEYQ